MIHHTLIKAGALFFSALLMLVISVDTAEAARKVCMDPDSGQIRARKLCGGLFTRELSADNIFTGQLIAVYFFETGTRVSGTETAGVVNRISAGFYDLTTSVADTSACVITVSQGLSSVGTLLPQVTMGAYSVPGDPSHIRVEMYDSSGFLIDAAVHLLVRCPPA